MSKEQADRHNAGKSKLSYILDAPRAIACMSDVMESGAKKYSRGNWKKGLSKEDVIDSLLRHLTKYQNGEILDKESGLPHVGHIMANAQFLAEFELRGDYAEASPATELTFTINGANISESDLDALMADVRNAANGALLIP